MSRYDIEIIPPGRSTVPAVQRPQYGAGALVTAPAPPPRGLFAGFRHRWQVEREQQTLALYEQRAKAEESYWDAQTKAFESAIKCRETAFRLATQGELVELQHVEQVRELQHRGNLAELRRRAEIAQVEAAQAEAEFARDAAREHGRPIARQRQENGLLDLQLAAEERRAVLRQYLGELRRSSGGQEISNLSDSTIDDSLYEARAQLNAHGLDTSRIDAVIEQRRGRRER